MRALEANWQPKSAFSCTRETVPRKSVREESSVADQVFNSRSLHKARFDVQSSADARNMRIQSLSLRIFLTTEKRRRALLELLMFDLLKDVFEYSKKLWRLHACSGCHRCRKGQNTIIGQAGRAHRNGWSIPRLSQWSRGHSSPSPRRLNVFFPEAGNQWSKC